MTDNEQQLRSSGPPLDGPSLDEARAWVDGDVLAEAAVAFERELQRSAGLQDAVDRAQAMREIFAQLPRFVTPAAIRGDLRDRLRDGRDRVVREVQALPRFNAPAPVREALIRQVREAAVVVHAERIAAGGRVGTDLAWSASTVGAAQRGGRRLRALPARFLVAASVMLAASVALLDGGRRAPVRPAGALGPTIEVARAEWVSIRRVAAATAAPKGRSNLTANLGGSR